MAFNTHKDHWAFLEEMEAPMWVDLTLEAKLNSQAIDEEWFRTTHLFHQCSSRQLKSAFACSGEDGVTLELDLAGSSSPASSQSVSRSRGKDYRTNTWRGDCHDGLSNKINQVKVVNGKSFGLDIGFGEEIKPKLSFIQKGTSSSKTSLVSEIYENAKGKNVKPVNIFRGPRRSSSPVADKSGETNTRSTVTSDSIQQQPHLKSFEVSSQGFGQRSELLTSVRLSLRKSCITRPASRVEIINANRRESRDHKSSSGKSSVGSTSFSGSDVKRSNIAAIKRKEETPDSRNGARMTEAVKNKVKSSNLCNTSNVRGKEGNRNSVKGGLATVARPACQEAAKPKVYSQTLLSRVSKPLKGNEQKSIAGATKYGKKVEVGRVNKVTHPGKENSTGEISQSQKFIGKGNIAGGMVVNRKGTSQTTSQKGGRTGMAVPKRGVANQREGKSSTNSTQRVYFR